MAGGGAALALLIKASPARGEGHGDSGDTRTTVLAAWAGLPRSSAGVPGMWPWADVPGDAIPIGMEREGFACHAWERVERAMRRNSHIPATAHFPLSLIFTSATTPTHPSRASADTQRLPKLLGWAASHSGVGFPSLPELI